MADDDKTLGDEIRSAMEVPANEAGETERADEEVLEHEADRDDKGRFKAKEDGVETPEAEEPESTETPEPAEAEEEQGEETAIEAPEHWSQPDRETFNGLEAKGQQFILDRHRSMEADYTRRVQEIAPLKQVADRWAPYAQQLGASFDQMVDNVMAAEYTLRTGTPTQKESALRKLAHDYGIPLEAQATQPEIDDPVVADAIAPLQDTVNQLVQAVNSRDQMLQQTQVSQAHASIEAFKTETDAEGNLVYPHFDTLLNDITYLASAERAAGRTPDLKTLYSKASRLNETVFSEIQKKSATAEKKQKNERAAKAKKASTSVTGSPGGSVTDEESKSLRDTIERAVKGDEARV